MAAHLYSIAGRHDLALAIAMRLRDPVIFDAIARHGLLASAHDHIQGLFEIDAVRATALLADHQEEVPPAAVVPRLQVRFSPNPY